jgi:hypothetical protein
MVNERGSQKTVEDSSKLKPCLARFRLALFVSHSNVRAIVWRHLVAEWEHAQEKTVAAT